MPKEAVTPQKMTDLQGEYDIQHFKILNLNKERAAVKKYRPSKQKNSTL